MVAPDLFAMVLRLRSERGAPPLSVSGHGVHAMFLELVRQVDAELANALHAKMLNKHFTVAALHPYGARLPLEVRVTLMRSDLFAPFSRALLEQSVRPALRLGRTPLVLADVFGTPGSHRWAGYDSFEQVAAAVVPTQTVSLRFATPTFMTQGSMRGSNKQRLNVLPLPSAVFGSLARRWNDLAPAALAVDSAAVREMAEDVLVARYRLETAAHRLRSNVQVGFVGRCLYELPPAGEVQRVLGMLADAAFYLGVGAKTTQGFGVCRREREDDGKGGRRESDGGGDGGDDGGDGDE